MKRFSFFHVPFMSFFSKDLYIDIGLCWKGVNFLYLLLLLAVCLVPGMVKVHYGFKTFINDEAPAMLDQIPEITIADGQVSINEPEPYYVFEPDTENVLAIIDTTGQITSLDDTDAFVLLTGDKILAKKNDFEKRDYDLSTVESFYVDSERITGWLEIIRKYFVAVIFPFALAGSYVYRIVQVLIYAAIGLGFASMCRITLSYGSLIRLAVATVTPCIIIGTICDLVGFNLPGPIYLAGALALLFFGVKSISNLPEADEKDYVEAIEVD